MVSMRLDYLLDSKLFVLKFEELTEESDVEFHKKEIFGQLNVFKNKFYASICNNLIELKVYYCKKRETLWTNVFLTTGFRDCSRQLPFQQYYLHLGLARTVC